jgi:hypothetical protein
VDGALECDGIDDYISTDFVLDPEDGSFSVFAWIKGGVPGQVIILKQMALALACKAAPNRGADDHWVFPPVGRLVHSR